MNVEPSTNTNLLGVTFDYESNMIDSSGNVVEDTWSISAQQYLENQGVTPVGGDASDDTEDSSDDDSYDDSYE